MLSKNHFSLWSGISACLIDTSEENHLSVNIILSTPEDVGLSDNEKQVVSELWQNPCEGMIMFKLYGSDEEFDLSEYEEFHGQIYDALVS